MHLSAFATQCARYVHCLSHNTHNARCLSHKTRCVGHTIRAEWGQRGRASCKTEDACISFVASHHHVITSSWHFVPHKESPRIMSSHHHGISYHTKSLLATLRKNRTCLQGPEAGHPQATAQAHMLNALRTSVQACTHARVHACTRARPHACTHTSAHACMHARMHSLPM